MTTNRYGLSRDIPRRIKHKVRQACGYGCVVCANAIYHYEHIDPPFALAREHDPRKIALLCGACHDKVTRRVWSKQRVLEALKNPKAKELGYSSFILDIGGGDGLVVNIGRTEFVGLENIILIDAEPLLSVRPPETDGSPPRLSARFFDRAGNEIAAIVDNEWRGTTDTFDIETRGPTTTVRSKAREIDLVVAVNPPSGVVIERLNLRFNGKTIAGSTEGGFRVISEDATVNIPSDRSRVEKAPHWLSITDTMVSLGGDSVIDFVSSQGDRSTLPGAYEVEGAELEFVDPAAEGIPPSPAGRPGGKIMRVSTTRAGGGVGIRVRPPRRTQAVADSPGPQRPTPYRRPSVKIGRNQQCPCGSGRKFKKCCGGPKQGGDTGSP